MIFNPILMRDKLTELHDVEENSLFKSFLRTPYDKNRPMGNVSIHLVNDTVGYYLLGMANDVAPMVPTIIDWLSIAIDEDENFGMHHNFHRYRLRSSLALTKWLLNGDLAIHDWCIARELALPNLSEEVYPKSKIKTDGLNEYLNLCIQAQQYQMGIVEFEKYHGVRDISLKRKLSPRDFGYAFCQHKAHGTFDSEALFLAGIKMLANNLEDHPWLGYGHYYSPACWLKTVYGLVGVTSPVEVIVKAYDNMPNVEKPDFI